MSKYRGVLYSFTKNAAGTLAGYTEEVVVERQTVSEIDKIIRPYIYNNFTTGEKRLLAEGLDYAVVTYNLSEGRITNSMSSSAALHEQMVAQVLGMAPRRPAVSSHFVFNEESDSTYSRRVMLLSPTPLTADEWRTLITRARARYTEIAEMKKVERINLATAKEQEVYAHGSWWFHRYWLSVNGIEEVPMLTNYN